MPGHVLLHVALHEAVHPVALAHVTHELHGDGGRQPGTHAADPQQQHQGHQQQAALPRHPQETVFKCPAYFFAQKLLRSLFFCET